MHIYTEFWWNKLPCFGVFSVDEVSSIDKMPESVADWSPKDSSDLEVKSRSRVPVGREFDDC